MLEAEQDSPQALVCAQEGDASYKQYIEERDATLASLKRRARKLCDGLNKLDGVTCAQLAVFPCCRSSCKLFPCGMSCTALS